MKKENIHFYHFAKCVWTMDCWELLESVNPKFPCMTQKFDSSVVYTVLSVSFLFIRSTVMPFLQFFILSSECGGDVICLPVIFDHWICHPEVPSASLPLQLLFGEYVNLIILVTFKQSFLLLNYCSSRVYMVSLSQLAHIIRYES